VTLQAENFAYHLSGKFLFGVQATSVEAKTRGTFWWHALSREQVLTQEVLNFGRTTARWTCHF